MSHKLLIVTTVPITLRSFLLPFAKHFQDLGWQVDGMAQCVSNDDICVNAFNQVWDIQWTRNVWDPRNLYSGISRIREVVTKGDYDLVHVHTPIAAFVTRFALRKSDKPKVIYTAHGFHFYKGGSTLRNLIFISLEKLAARWTDYIVTMNHEDETAAKKYHFLPDERIIYTRGIGVDTQLYASSAVSTNAVEIIHNELGLSSDNVLLLSIGELIPRKRHGDLLQALAVLSNPRVHLAIAGDGPKKADLEKLSVKLGIKKQVHFLGFRSDIPTLIQAADAVLLVSQQEGLPRSVMESMCLEKPVIGSNIRGTQDLLENNSGILVELGNTAQLAEAMANIVEGGDNLIVMTQNAKNKIAEYDIEPILAQHTALFKLALS